MRSLPIHAPIVALAAMASLAGPTVFPASAVEAAVPEAGAFEPLEAPCRSLDTRDNGSPVRAGRTVTADLTDCGVPRGALAVAVSVTAVQPRGNGHLIVWPSGDPKPDTSTVNYNELDRAVANAAWVGVNNGRVDIASHATSHVLVDVTGYWTAAAPGEETGGRIKMLPEPVRAVDTREDDDARTPMAVDVHRRLSIDSASAALINVTHTGGFLPSHVTVWEWGDPMPETSVVNVAGMGARASGMVIAPLGPLGTFSFAWPSRSSDVIIDIVGYIDDTASDSRDGLFVPTSPRRLLDSRDGGMVGEGGFVSIVTARDRAGALVGNTTLVPHRPTHATVTQPGRAGEISTVNALADPAAANTITRLSDRLDGEGVARVAMGAGLGHVIFDSTGYVTGPRAGTHSGDLEARRTPNEIGPKVRRPFGHRGDERFIRLRVVPCLTQYEGALAVWNRIGGRGVVWRRDLSVPLYIGGITSAPDYPGGPLTVSIGDESFLCGSILHSAIHALDLNLGVTARDPLMCGDPFVTAEGLALAGQIAIHGWIEGRNDFYRLVPEIRECADRADVQARVEQMWHELR